MRVDRTLRRSSSFTIGFRSMGNVFTRCFKPQQQRSSSLVHLDTSRPFNKSETSIRTALSPKRVESLTDDFAKTKLDHGDTKEVKPLIEEVHRLPELPNEAIELCKRVWEQDNNLDEVFVKEFSIPITRKDLQTLYYLQWLNDEVINFYFSLICERAKLSPTLPKVYAFNTYFYTSYCSRGYSGVRRWTKNMNIFDNDFILIPLHLQNVHWCLIVVNFEQKQIGFFDSMGTDGRGHVSKIIDYLKQESEDKHKSEYNDVENFELVYNAKVPKQSNGSDCGVFTCQFGEYISRRARLDFSQSDIDYFRERMVYEITNKKLML